MQPWQNENTFIIWYVIGLFLVLIISVGFILLLKTNHKKHVENKKKIKVLNEQHKNKLEISSVLIQEKERQRIGSDLHDSVINSLNVLYLKSQAGQSDQKMLINDIQETIFLTRRISHDLNPPLLEYQNIEDLCRDIIKQWATFYNTKTNINTQQFFDLTVEQKVHLIRMVQELITNIHKHAKATSIELTLRTTKQNLMLLVKDDGIGFSYKPHDKTTGLGLQNIQARAKILNATFKYKKGTTNGTTFIFLMPKNNLR